MATTWLLCPFRDAGLTYLRARPPALCSELSCTDGPGQVWSLSHTAHGLTSKAAVSQTPTPEEVGRKTERRALGLHTSAWGSLPSGSLVLSLPQPHVAEASVWVTLCLSCPELTPFAIIWLRLSDSPNWIFLITVAEEKN